MKILIISEDQQIARELTFCLQVRYPELKTFTVDKASRAMEIINDDSLDLVLLDSSLQGQDAIIPIRKIREYSDVPLIVLTSTNNPMERAIGMEAGADGFIPRSFNPMELLAHCKALLRRTLGESFTNAKAISLDSLTIDLKAHQVFHAGELVKLTPIEYRLLSELVRNEGNVVTTRELLDKVWGPEYIRDSDLVKTYIYRLRSKIQSQGVLHAMILNERGFGYRIAKGS